MYSSILLFHLLGAAIWTGGHLILATLVLPKALRERSVTELMRFESAYEKIGIPALIIQIATGVWLARMRTPDLETLFDLADPNSRLVLLKLGLLALTAAFAVDARFRIIPNLTPEKLTALAFHVVPVTVISVLFVAVGVAFRSGGWA